MMPMASRGLPSSIKAGGAEYKIERDGPQSVYFRIMDQSGKEVARGGYEVHPTEMDARLSPRK